MVLKNADGALTLEAHVARPNRHWTVLGSRPAALAVFQGPHTYVSPSWYEQPAQAVPTWNFTSVHVHGPLAIFDDATKTRGVLDALIDRFENHRPAPWKLALSDRQRDAMMGAIVGFEMPIRRIDAKFKLSQNRSRDDRLRVIEALGTRGEASSSNEIAFVRRKIFAPVSNLLFVVAGFGQTFPRRPTYVAGIENTSMRPSSATLPARSGAPAYSKS